MRLSVHCLATSLASRVTSSEALAMSLAHWIRARLFPLPPRTRRDISAMSKAIRLAAPMMSFPWDGWPEMPSIIKDEAQRGEKKSCATYFAGPFAGFIVELPSGHHHWLIDHVAGLLLRELLVLLLWWRWSRGWNLTLGKWGFGRRCFIIQLCGKLKIKSFKRPFWKISFEPRASRQLTVSWSSSGGGGGGKSGSWGWNASLTFATAPRIL